MRGSSAIATGNYESKNALIVFGSFLIIVILVTSIVIFYISNNIVLTELGYKLIKLENEKIALEEENKKLELTVETLSAFDRIEKIAYNQLGMVRPKEVKFIALNPVAMINSVNDSRTISNNYKEEKNFWASFDLNKINDLISGILK
ncbi:cell division protein FtsL [bacterium]|jgi:cell division protein FtsL|nr:cell division protein FtsL [bacterium]MBU4362213.1 cell division protein FtsL [bacterium]MBU4603147.1 cell division protein FtsL [bacterium]MCG2762224.1 cell division protein FtsL [Candidatus Atribacteria bacterium]